MTLSGASTSVLSSQNADVLGFRKKKRGRMGKKKPIKVPCIKAVFDDDPWDNEAEPTVSIESIHCSSIARACSSSEAHCVSYKCGSKWQKRTVFVRLKFPVIQEIGRRMCMELAAYVGNVCF